MTTLATSEHIAFVATADPPRAEQFYRSVLGLQFVADEPFALVFRLRGTMLRIAKVQHFTPAPFTVLGWIVPDIAAAVRGLRHKGVTFERYPGLAQDDLGVCTFPHGAKVAWFKDPDGNTLSLTEFAP